MSVHDESQDADRQLDIILVNSQYYDIPKQAPGRLTKKDLIMFIWSPEVDPTRYTIIVEALDTAGATFRSIGKLASTLELPFVKFSPYAQVGASPDSSDLPAFRGLLVRGATYYLPPTGGQKGIFRLKEYGTH